MSIVLITGASSGIGRKTAILLAKNGYRVYGAARRTEILQELEPFGVKALTLDVTDNASMVQCIREILEKEGKIDVLINNAGYGSYGTLEEVSMEEARRQLDVNLLGVGRMTQLVLPSMRKNGSGKIINISSMAGRVSTPFGTWYHTYRLGTDCR